MTREATTHLTVDQIRRKVEKKYGPGILIQGSELKDRVIPRITTGSLSLDVMLGGGFPINQFHQIVGEFSSGKTSLTYKTIAANQKLDPNWFVVWVASEPFVEQWAVAAGCDLDRIEIVDEQIMEVAFGIVLDFVTNRACDCVVIDSLPQLVPSDENEGGLDNWQMGLSARLNNKFFRIGRSASRRSMVDDDRPCTFLVINQFREKIGVTHGDNRTTPGGKGKDFAYCTITEVRRKEWIEHEKERVGIRIAARTVKNKSAPQQRVAEVNFYYADVGGFRAGDFDVADDLVGTAAYVDVISRSGGGNTYFFGDTKLGVGIGKTLELVRQDLDLQKLIRERTLAVTAASFAPDMDLSVAEVSVPEPAPKPAPKPRLVRKRAS